MKNFLGIVKVFQAEFITKQAQQTGHLTVLSWKRNLGHPTPLILHIQNHHNSVLVAIELKGITIHPNLLNTLHL